MTRQGLWIGRLHVKQDLQFPNLTPVLSKQNRIIHGFMWGTCHQCFIVALYPSNYFFRISNILSLFAWVTCYIWLHKRHQNPLLAIVSSGFVQEKDLEKKKKNLLVVCKVTLRTIILRDNIIRKHWWTIKWKNPTGCRNVSIRFPCWRDNFYYIDGKHGVHVRKQNFCLYEKSV